MIQVNKKAEISQVTVMVIIGIIIILIGLSIAFSKVKDFNGILGIN